MGPGAHFLGIEIEPRYVDVIVRRLQAFTGETPLWRKPDVRSTRPPTEEGENNDGR